MIHQMMMISKTGNRALSWKNLFLNPRAYTFIEVMVTVSILSLGLVMIYSALLTSLDRMSYLTNRLYAHHLLDNRIAALERMLRSYKALPFDVDQQETINVGNKNIEFTQQTIIKEVDNFLDVFQVDLTLTWMEKQRQLRMMRSAYISDFETPSIQK